MKSSMGILLELSTKLRAWSSVDKSALEAR